MTTLKERLDRREIIVIDGGIGTEIQRRGVPMDNHAWCGVANKSHPEIVLQTHMDYVRAGAQVVTANTFGTARHVLEPAGLGDEVEAINRKAVELAREACDEAADGQVWVAGSMSSMPPLTELVKTPRGDAIKASYNEQAQILADAGVDLIVTEMMLDVENASLVMAAAVATGLPVWIGFSAEVANGAVQTYRGREYNTDMPPEAFGEIIGPILAFGCQAAGVMHSRVEDTGPALKVLSDHWSGPTLAYAESGEFVPPDWQFVDIISPEDYARKAREWVEIGAQIVGGCCGTGPAHIRRLKELLPPTLPDSA